MPSKAYTQRFAKRGVSYKRELAGLLAQEEWLQVTVREAILIDGCHHKQYYLQLIARQLGCEVPGTDPGIAP